MKKIIYFFVFAFIAMGSSYVMAQKPNRASLMRTTPYPDKTGTEIFDKGFAARFPIEIFLANDGGELAKDVLVPGYYVDVVAKALPEGGNLVIFDIHLPERDFTLSWSGTDVHLVRQGNVIGAMRGTESSNNFVLYDFNSQKWGLLMSACDWMTSGLTEGMTINEVAAKFETSPGNISAKGKVGKYLKYSFDSVDLKKRYHRNGDYHYGATTTSYVDLFFNANKKLESWRFNY